MALPSIRSRLGLFALLLAVSAPAADVNLPLAWHGTVEVAAGRGELGPWRQNESRYDYVDDPTVALDERGDAAVAWADQGRKDVFFQRFPASGAKPLAAPVNVSRSPATFSWLPRVIVAPGAPQRVYILWQEIIFSGGSHGGDILFALSRDGGASFSEPLNLSNSVGGDGKGRIDRDIWHNGSLDLAVGADGTLYAAWTEYDGPLWFSRSSDGGNSFSHPVRIADSGPARPARAPSLAVGPGRTVYLAWTVGEDEGADIRVAKSTDGGTSFDAPRLVAPSKTYSDSPKLAVDAGGTLHLVYAESVGGPFEAHRIRYTRSADGARTFEPSREISALLPPFTSAGFPQLAVDAAGRLYVLWDLFHDRQARPAAQGMAVSIDGGRTFTAPAPVPGSAAPRGGANGSRQGLLMKKLAVNGAGAVAIVNSSLKPDEYSRVWLTRASLPTGREPRLSSRGS